ncbi:MAG: type II toxin-antitoxin system YafQ family toxin [Methanosarcina mazei]|jgi:mRNA interferase YafQ|nr:MAG: type II toxin-antitoxin system YafQ family toxin [Methanosarcina mazei]
MKYNVKFTSQFKKDIKRARKQGKNLDELFSVIETLLNNIPLEEQYRDHALKGEYSSYRECHIEPDWLLIYQKVDDCLILILYRVGSHSELF